MDHTPYEYWLELKLAILREEFVRISSAKDEDASKMIELASQLEKVTKDE